MPRAAPPGNGHRYLEVPAAWDFPTQPLADHDEAAAVEREHVAGGLERDRRVGDAERAVEEDRVAEPPEIA